MQGWIVRKRWGNSASMMGEGNRNCWVWLMFAKEVIKYAG